MNKISFTFSLIAVLWGSVLFGEDQPVYQETYRPQFHFTAAKDWLNDPNGMVFYKGEYHLFFQRTPDSLESGLKSWGQAVSPDMLHWKQLDDAIKPDVLGDIWSGSAVVDWTNTAGFQTGEEKPIVAIYTAAGKTFGQCLTYSNDRGRTWTKYAHNPVIPNLHGMNRDPKLVWYAPTKKWIVAIYLDDNDKYELLSSSDLKTWVRLQTVSIPGAAECPDFFQINLDGDSNKPRWVMTGANGRYLVGTFDGTTFTYDKQSRAVEYGANCYAVQTFSDIPSTDNRRIQIGWMVDGKYPKMPFNQQMSFPCELKLRSTPAGPRLFKYPVREIEALHGPEHQLSDLAAQPDSDLLNHLTGDCFDIIAEFDPSADSHIKFNIRGSTVEYNAQKKLLTNGHSAALSPDGNRIRLRLLIDRTSIEVFGNDGQAAISTCFLPDPQNRSITLTCSGGTTRVVSLKCYPIKSAWGSDH